MHVALLGEFRGGSGESLITLAEYLSADHDVSVFGYPIDSSLVPTDARAGDVRFDRLVLYPHEWNRVLRSGEVLVRFRSAVADAAPDVIVSQLETALLGAYASDRLDVPHLVYLHDDSMLPDHSLGFGPVALLRTLGSYAERGVLGYVFGHTDRVVANSRDTADRYEAYWGFETDVVYPFVDVETYRVDERGEGILHVNPSHHKGIDVTLDIAARCPDRQFVVAGTPSADSEWVADELTSRDNVDWRGHVDDMREVYRDTKLVVMPSRAETFGRVPIEAGISGIPTVAADTGGLPEAVGSDDLVVDGTDPERYVETIETVEGAYDQYATAARENAEAKCARVQYERFDRLLGAVSSDYRTAAADESRS